jgi:7-cyano-7-deazaguanine synthase in queuosine biosynthesis
MDKRFPSAILFSGGLDSTAAAILMPDAALIRVATGSCYDTIERTHARVVAGKLGRELVEVDVLNLRLYEDSDALMPGRNGFLVMAAALHAVNVMLISVAGDGTHATDKDAKFADLTSKLIKHLHGDGQVMLPFRRMSKNELASAARRAGVLDDVLPYVFSCYRPPSPSLHCGECKACVRLWAACASIGATAMPLFAVLPYTLPPNAYMEVFAGRGEEEHAARMVYDIANQ